MNPWFKLSLVSQMANIGSEVFRAIKWQPINPTDSYQAFIRSLELLDLTINDPKNINRLKEVSRAKELFGTWYLSNQADSLSAGSWNKYFFQFNYAARLNR